MLVGAAALMILDVVFIVLGDEGLFLILAVG